MVKKAVSNKLNYNNKIKTIKRTPKIGASISVLKDKNYNSKEDVGLKKRKELVIKKKEDKHDLNNNINKENTNGKGKCGKKNVNSTISTNTSTITSASTTSTKSLESSVPIVKTTLNNKQEIAPKRNCLSASSNSSYSSTSTNSSNSSNSTSESVKHLSPTQRAVHRKYCETVKLKNQKKQLEQQLDHQNSSNNNNNLKLFFKDKVVMLNIGTLTGKYFQIEAFWTDTIGDLKEIIQDKEGILKESQILIYQGKSLINDNYTLRDYNLQDGATLKLALQMSGGPGALGGVKKKKTCDTVILLLCKKNNELLIFEINPNDDPSQSLIPKKVFQINGNVQPIDSSYNSKNKYHDKENELEKNKKINYMPHLNNTIDQSKKNSSGTNLKSDGLNNSLLSPEIVQEIEKRAIASTLQGYNVTLAVQNLDNINEGSGFNSKKSNNNCSTNSVLNSSESSLKNEYLDENNNLIQNNILNTDDEYKSEEISISNINSTVLNSIESKIQKHLFLENGKEKGDTIYNDNTNDSDSLFQNFIHRPPSDLGSCSNRSYDTSISFPSRPSSAESDSSLTSLIQECTAAAAQFRETINKSQQFLNMYLNSDDEDKNLECFEYKNKNFNYTLSTNRDSPQKLKKPFSPYLDIQELGTLTISNNYANQAKYNYMPIMPSPISYDNFKLDIPASLPTSVNTNDKPKLSTRPSTAICITPIANSVFPFMVMPKTRPSSAIEFSKSTKQYQMVLSNLWVNSKFHKKYLEKIKKKEQSKSLNINLVDEILNNDENKITEDFDQLPSEETSFILMNSNKKQTDNENNELEDIEEDIQYDYISNDENKINILDDLEFNLTKKLNYFCINDAGSIKTKKSLNCTSSEKNTVRSQENDINKIYDEDYTNNLNIMVNLKNNDKYLLNNEIKDDPEIPEVINTSDNIINEKLTNTSFMNKYYCMTNLEDNNCKNTKNIDNIKDSKLDNIKKLSSDFIDNKTITSDLKLNSHYNNNNNNINKSNQAATQSVNPKCHICNKKLGLMSGFKCKCGNIFCSVHRYSDSHNCTYDYKHQGKIQLTKNNPLFKNDKLVRI